MSEIFDCMPDIYEAWFSTPLGKIIKQYELELVLDFLKPQKGDTILDAGCGTGIFTSDILIKCAKITGLDISKPMLIKAAEKMSGCFSAVQGNMLSLPFKDNAFDKTLSITAIEFIKDASVALYELARVTKPGGIILAATLNRLSPWADKRQKHAESNDGIFSQAIFRSPVELAKLLPYESNVKTSVYFPDGSPPQGAISIEKTEKLKNPPTGAFVACLWKKPHTAH